MRLSKASGVGVSTLSTSRAPLLQLEESQALDGMVFVGERIEDWCLGLGKRLTDP